MKKTTLFFMMILICFLMAGCNEKYDISKNIPDAENSCFTTDGRLFVTGGTNIYEILGDGRAIALCQEGKYNFTGMAQVGNYLYAIGTEYRFNSSPAYGPINFLSSSAVEDFVNCIGDMLKRSVVLCAQIVPGNLNFTEIYTLQKVFIPNGMVADGSGNLYVANQTFLPMGKILRLTLSDPMTVADQQTWLDQSDNVYSPNGMSIRGSNIYFSDFRLFSFKPAAVKKVTINNNGSPGSVATLYERTSFFDDLSAGTVYGRNEVVVADYVKGSLLFIRDDGKKHGSPDYETDAALFDCPSSVRFGKGPFYSPSELIITEKGIMFEHNLNFGNKLSGMDID